MNIQNIFDKIYSMTSYEEVKIYCDVCGIEFPSPFHPSEFKFIYADDYKWYIFCVELAQSIIKNV